MAENKNNKPVLFLGGGGSDRSIAACVRSLNRQDIPFHICLPQNGKVVPWFASKYRDHILKDRYASPRNIEDFKKSLSKATEHLPGVVLFPTSERTTRPLLKDPEWLREHDIQLPVSGYDSYVTVSDKSSFTEAVTEYGLKVPGELSSQLGPDAIPFVAKPKTNLDGSGKQKRPYLIFDEADLRRFKSLEDEEEYFYQEFIQGKSVYYCAIYDCGKLLCDFSQLTLTQQPNGGSVVKASPTKIPKRVTSKFSELMKELEWTGPIMVEFRESGGEYYAIETNPRFWGPLQLTVDNNVDFPLRLYQSTVSGLETTYETRESISETTDIGYIRINGYISGLWKKYFIGSGFEKTSAEEKEISYRDVWFRSDTYPIFIFEGIRSLLYPLSVVINSPKKVLNNLSGKLAAVRSSR